MGAGGEVGKTKGNLYRAKGTFSKRKDCILKKTRELSVLCDVKACAIVFRPDNGRVETWPENLNEVQQVIDAYKDYSLKKKNGSISGDGDAKKRNYTGYIDFVGVEKKQKLSSATEMEYLSDELKKIDSTLEQVRNRIQILKQQKEGHGYGYGCQCGCGCGCGCGRGYASSSSSKHSYEDFAAASEGLLQIEDFDELVERFSGRLPGYVGQERGFSFCHVDDVAQGHIAAMNKGQPGERYLLTGENASFKDVFDLAATITNTAKPWFGLPLLVVEAYGWLSVFFSRITGKLPLISPPTVHVLRHQWAYTCEKAKAELDYNPRSLREGLSEMLPWLKSLGLIKY